MTEACEQTSTGLAIGALLASSSARCGAEGASTAVVEASDSGDTSCSAGARGLPAGAGEEGWRAGDGGHGLLVSFATRSVGCSELHLERVFQALSRVCTSENPCS